MDSNGQTIEGTLSAIPRVVLRGLTLFALVLTTTACPSVADPYAPLPMPDYNKFVSEIQPLVGQHCAFAGCHGAVGRSLTLYAVDYLRAPPEFSDKPLDEKRLTDAELSWNFDAMRMRMRSATKADTSELALKCLDPQVGGIRHASGVVVFADRSDPDYQTLVAWIAGGIR